MQPENRGTLEYISLSSNIKSCNNEQEIEQNTFISSLSTPEIQDLLYSPSLPTDQAPSNYAVYNSTSSLILSCTLNENSCKNSIPNDISMSRSDVSVHKKITTYPTNQQNCLFQSSWFNDRKWLEYSRKNDTCYCCYCRHFSSN